MGMEVEEMGLTLSITKGGEEGKNHIIASCSFLEDKLQECDKKVAFVCSVETFWS